MRSLSKNSYKKYHNFYIVVIFCVYIFIIVDVDANIRTFYTI